MSELMGSFRGSKEQVPNNLIRQYVADVVDFTSQYGTNGSISYTAHNIIGKPNIYPEYGDFPQAFIMRTYGRWWEIVPSGSFDIEPQNFGGIRSQDFIDVYFERKVYAVSIEIYETYKPGAVVRIWAGDGQGRWSVLWQGLPQLNLPEEARIFKPEINTPTFPTNLLRIEFDHRHLNYHTELDAVLLSGSFDLPMTCRLGSGELTRKVMSLNLHRLPLLPSVNASKEQTELQRTDDSPFSILPLELMLQVLSWLDLRSLCRCVCVNKRFQEVASDPTLYTKLNLRAYWWLVNSQCLISLAPRCYRIQVLDLSWCTTKNCDFNPAFMRFIEESGEDLQILRLNNCKFLNKESLLVVSKTCLALEELSVRCVNVREGWSSLSSLFQLKRLDFYNCPAEGKELLILLSKLPHLQHLGLGATSLGANLDLVAALLPSSCPLLVSLDLWKAHSLSVTGLQSLAQLRNLKELDIGWCCEIEAPADSLRALALGCPLLQKLFLSAMRGVAERELLFLAEKCPNLEQLDLLGARGVTAELCLRLLAQCRKLQLLDVSYCVNITDTHVSQWRALFPHVNIQFSRTPDDNE